MTALRKPSEVAREASLCGERRQVGRHVITTWENGAAVITADRRALVQRLRDLVSLEFGRDTLANADVTFLASLLESEIRSASTAGPGENAGGDGDG